MSPLKRTKKFFGVYKYALLAPPFVLLALVVFSFSTPYLFLEYLSINIRYRARAAADPSSHEDLVILGINEDSIKAFKDYYGRWPWSRDVHGDLLKQLAQRPPKVIAFDIFFPESSMEVVKRKINQVLQDFYDLYTDELPEIDTEIRRWLSILLDVFDEDGRFVEGVAYHSGVVTGALTQKPTRDNPNPENVNLPEDFSYSMLEPFENIKGDEKNIYGYPTALYPIEPLQVESHTAFVDVEASRIDGIRRRYPMIIRTNGMVYPSLALKSVLLYYDITPDEVEIVLGKYIRFETFDGEKRIPINGRGEYFINYRREDIYKAPGYAQIYLELLNGERNEDAEWPEHFPPLEGQILVIGQTAAGLTDFGVTPFKGRSPLVRVQANVIDNILKQDYLTIPPLWPFVVGSLLVMWVTLVLLKDRPVVLSIGVPALIVFLYIGASFWVFADYSFQMPLVWPVLGFAGVHLGAYYLHWKKEADQKKRIKGMFGTYLSPDLVDKMVDSGEEPQLGGEDVNISAFFSDVQSFSSFSEKLTPQQLVDLMNEYLTAMTKILMEQGCYVDKYIGDAIVGIFNAPVELQSHALKGCIACMLQHKRLAELREKWKSEGDKWPPIVHNMQARMGMNTGQATVGNMGSEDRFNYTMMGDTVNLAARCESGAKAYGVYTMVTGETREAAEAEGDACVFRYLDKIVVKGRSQPAEMYEVVCLREDITPEVEQCLSVYDKAMKAYLEQRFDEAYAGFLESAKLEPNRPELNPNSPTTPSEVMAQRSLDYKANPPGEGWDGVYVMTSK